MKSSFEKAVSNCDTAFFVPTAKMLLQAQTGNKSVQNKLTLNLKMMFKTNR